MSETTKQMNAMTGEYVAMKESAQHYDSLMNGLQKENESFFPIHDDIQSYS